jgi:AcrB/AcrD/AcrF family
VPPRQPPTRPRAPRRICGDNEPTPEQFGAIILKSAPDGSIVHLADVARIELGPQSYGGETTYNGLPTSGMGIELASGANALTTAQAVKATLARLARTLPPGVEVVYSSDSTPFVARSIHEVLMTLLEAMSLVFVVMLLFLQNLRATLIPTLAIPVVLLGTLGVLAAFGYSINILTMFAMVLAIGLLVDDAIVVVENVERVMVEDKLSPLEATRKSMREITGALVGIATVLSAVFVLRRVCHGCTHGGHGAPRVAATLVVVGCSPCNQIQSSAKPMVRAAIIVSCMRVSMKASTGSELRSQRAEAALNPLRRKFDDVLNFQIRSGSRIDAGMSRCP